MAVIVMFCTLIAVRVFTGDIFCNMVGTLILEYIISCSVHSIIMIVPCPAHYFDPCCRYCSYRCGPCKGSKPKLKELAGTSPLPIGYVHEEDIEDFLEIFVQIKAFPTYIVFKNGAEIARVEGVNFEALEKMILDHTMA
jgi:thiol-disulfide isomerase/thioredoxin